MGRYHVKSYRFKTQAEIELEFGDGWLYSEELGIVKSMRYLLGQTLTDLDAFMYEQAKVTTISGIFQLCSNYDGCTHQIRDVIGEKWHINPELIVEMEPNTLMITNDLT